LAQAGTEGPAFVADMVHTGTTLYTAPLASFLPRFGPGSRLAHLGSGARELEGAAPGLRCDVDDLDDLRRAQELGVGAHTSLAEAPRTQ
jgi:2-phospho-L-lactate guanylyltransferase